MDVFLSITMLSFLLLFFLIILLKTKKDWGAKKLKIMIKLLFDEALFFFALKMVNYLHLFDLKYVKTCNNMPTPKICAHVQKILYTKLKQVYSFTLVKNLPLFDISTWPPDHLTSWPLISWLHDIMLPNSMTTCPHGHVTFCPHDLINIWTYNLMTS